MAKYPFLSDEWLAEARLIYTQAEASEALARPAGLAPVRVNLVVTDVPFSGSSLDAHVDTSAGRVAIDTGHLTEPDVTISLEYTTARSLFVSGDVQAALQAFLTGRIKVDGDLTKLLDPRSGIWPAGGMAPSPGRAANPAGQPALGSVAPEAQDVAARLQAITE
jgi:SCP-2 sterol transfer family